MKMDNWTEGYVGDINYTHGYYQELNPSRIKLAFLNAGLDCSEYQNACELGFGQGISINIHAAASSIQWFGTDFNPSQANYAKRLARSNNSSINLSDDSFKEFVERKDVPEFDFIAMHGIWSWINDANRLLIVEFLKNKLKVGGVLYISYNTLPGWGDFAPVRHLMTQHATVMGSNGAGVVKRVDEAIEYVKELRKTKPVYLQVSSQIEEKFNKLEKQNRQYLAHEYFNMDWHPMYFSEVSKLLATAKLSYACSANYLDHIDLINLTEEQQKFLQSIQDKDFKETTRDFIINKQFRKDYWVKGKLQLTELEQLEKFKKIKIFLTEEKKLIELKVIGELGEANMSDSIYMPILNLIERNRIITIEDMEKELKSEPIEIGQIMQSVMILIGKGCVATVQNEEMVNEAQKNTDLLNREIMQKAMSSNDINYLASPVTGGGIPVGRFHQLFLLAYSNGKKTAEDWANFVWKILAKQGQKLIKDGKVIEHEDENISELLKQANEFKLGKFEILKTLKVI
jgi:hypothetical protein